MKSRNPQEVQRQQRELEILENRLQTAYPTVRPRPEYVRNLRNQLDLQLDPGNASNEKHGWRLMLVAASLLSGTFVIVLAVRGILTFFGGMQQLSSQVDADRIAPVNPAL